MFDIFKIFTSDKNSSKNIAKERLKLVLINDKNNFSPTVMEALKDDIIKVIQNYMEVDEENIEVKMIKSKTHSNTEMVSELVANIPIKKIK